MVRVRIRYVVLYSIYRILESLSTISMGTNPEGDEYKVTGPSTSIGVRVRGTHYQFVTYTLTKVRLT